MEKISGASLLFFVQLTSSINLTLLGLMEYLIWCLKVPHSDSSIVIKRVRTRACKLTIYVYIPRAFMVSLTTCRCTMLQCTAMLCWNILSRFLIYYYPFEMMQFYCSGGVPTSSFSSIVIRSICILAHMVSHLHDHVSAHASYGKGARYCSATRFGM